MSGGRGFVREELADLARVLAVLAVAVAVVGGCTLAGHLLLDDDGALTGFVVGVAVLVLLVVAQVVRAVRTPLGGRRR